MGRKKILVPGPGEWVSLPNRWLTLRCCDCRLVHAVQFRVRGRRLEMRAWRDERKTSASRRRRRRHR